MKLAIAVGSTAIASLLAGAAAGYLFAKRQLSMKFDERLKAEIEETRAFYKKVYKEDEFQTPEKAVETLLPGAAKALRAYKGIEPQVVITDEDLVEIRDKLIEANVFDNAGDSTEEIEETDIRNRTEEAPFILSKDEFMSNDSGYTQSTLTYYAGDGVLMDEREDRIDEVDKTVAERNLKRFGYGSGDPRVVYIRNDALEIEFEVLRHDGKYSKDVAGLEE